MTILENSKWIQWVMQVQVMFLEKSFVSAGTLDSFDYSGSSSKVYVWSNGKPYHRQCIRLWKDAIQAAFYAQSGKNRDAVTMTNAYHYT
jgi:hypothetical protein